MVWHKKKNQIYAFMEVAFELKVKDLRHLRPDIDPDFLFGGYDAE